MLFYSQSLLPIGIPLSYYHYSSLILSLSLFPSFRQILLNFFRKIDILLKSTVKLIQENLKEEKENDTKKERKLEALIESLELDKSLQEMIKVFYSRSSTFFILSPRGSD